MTRIAIITGAASGIGRALAAALVARGDTVVVADIDGEAAGRVAGELARHGPAPPRRRRWTSATALRCTPWCMAPATGTAGWM